MTKVKVDTQEKLVYAIETIEGIEILNKNKFLGISDDNFCNGEFCRNLEIFMNGGHYGIVWFNNYSTFVGDRIEANFDSITLNKPTPPTANKKLKLQLSKDGQTCCVVG